MVPTLSLPHIPGAAALSSKSSVRTPSSVNNKTSRINIASLVADASAQNSASSLECARAFCLRVAEWSGHPSTSVFNLGGFFLSWTFPAQPLSVQTGKNASCGSVVVRSRSHEKIPADWVPAKWPSGEHIVSVASTKLFGGCLVSFPQALVSNCSSQRSLDMWCTLSTSPRWGLLYSCMGTPASLSGFCWTDPAPLGVGAGFSIRQLHAEQHYPRVSPVGHDLRPIILQHSLTLELFIPHSNLIHCPDVDTKLLREVRLDLLHCLSRHGCYEDRPCGPRETHPVHSSRRTLGPHHIFHRDHPASSSASPTIQLFPQSPKHGG